MTRIQIGFTGRYKGRGFWRQIFGSGPLRLTPIDVPVSDKDRQEVEAATNALQAILQAQQPTNHRLGSLFDLTEVKAFVNLKTE